MQGLRTIAAIVAGFGFMASTVMVGSIITTALFAPASMPSFYMTANLGVSLIGAVMGGWLAARIGALRSRTPRHSRR